MTKKNNNIVYKNPRLSDFVNAICKNYDLDYQNVKAFLLVNFPELKDKKVCANCGESMKAYWHSLTSGLVGDLIKAIEFVRTNNKNCFHLAKDLQLTKSQYNNFQKLRFHALVAKDKDHKEAGYWLITKRGGQFLRGEVEVPRRVQTFRNSVIEHSDELVSIRNFKNDFPFFESEFASEIQQGKLL